MRRLIIVTAHRVLLIEVEAGKAVREGGGRTARVLTWY